ncbi:MAG: thrombospondin type 3 repeat-containing protein [Chloroflexota bacterium]
MLPQKLSAKRLYVMLILLGLAILLAIPAIISAAPLSARQQLRTYWQQAGDLGVYHYRTEAVQTLHPTERLANVGRSSKTQRLSVAGFMDKPNDGMQMRLSRGNGGNTVDIKMEEGITYGRLTPQDDWTKIEAQHNLFAPGGDPLGYLNAAENIEAFPLGTEALRDWVQEDVVVNASLSTLNSATRYTFDLSGPKYAGFMRDQMEAELRRKGELPPGLTLGLAETYVDMTGHGEIWFDEDNRPVRQIIHIEFPPEKGALNWIEADIATTFTKWGQQNPLQSRLIFALEHVQQNPTDFFDNPQTFFANAQITFPEAQLQNLVLLLSAFLVLGGTLALMLVYWQSPKLYSAVSLTMILSMVVTPLFQSHQVSAFYETQHQRQDEHEQERLTYEDDQQRQAETTGQTFNPRQKPAFNRTTDQRVDPQLLSRNPFVSGNTGSAAPALNTVDAENCETETDTDGDGLSDNVECYETGTWVDDPDTDDDSIIDSTEVQGFVGGDGTRWYLDPRNPDTNGDGQLDTLECPQLVTLSDTKCQDTDDDGVPDVFDFDNDGDGVPDTVDSSPDTVVGDLTNGLTDGLLTYDVAMTGTGHLLYMDFEVRPTNEDHLWHVNNVFDWPNNDTAGQIKRQSGSTTSETFLDYDLGQYESNPRADHGDIQVTPLLEIKISYDANNPSGGLPISSTVQNTSVISYNNTDWVDTTLLEEYGISVNHDENSGNTLYAYVPLIELRDSTGDTPVAFTGRMVYEPDVTRWGKQHQARVVWMINVLNDTCDTESVPEKFTVNGKEVERDKDDNAYELWCSMDSYTDGNTTINIWHTSQEVIQTYYDDFYLTGLTLQEDHGLRATLIADNDTNLDYESNLWHVANSLQTTWLEGQIDNGSRFDVFDIDSALSGWGVTNNLTTKELSFDSVVNLKDIITTHNRDVLNTAFGSNATDGYHTSILYAGEETSRDTGLLDSNTDVDDNSLSFDISDRQLQTSAFLRWSPFVYNSSSGQWDSADFDTYATVFQTRLGAAFTNDRLDDLVNDTPISDYDTARKGATQMALTYYATLYKGATFDVEIDGQSTNTDPLATITYSKDPALVATEAMLVDIQAYFDALSLDVTTADDDELLSTWNILAESASVVVEAVGDATEQKLTVFNTALTELSDYYKTHTYDSQSDFVLTTPFANTILGASTVKLTSEEIGATRTILSAVSNIKYNVKMMRWYVDKAVRYKNALKVSQ